MPHDRPEKTSNPSDDDLKEPGLRSNIEEDPENPKPAQSSVSQSTASFASSFLQPESNHQRITLNIQRSVSTHSRCFICKAENNLSRVSPATRCQVSGVLVEIFRFYS